MTRNNEKSDLLATPSPISLAILARAASSPERNSAKSITGTRLGASKLILVEWELRRGELTFDSVAAILLILLLQHVDSIMKS